MMQQTSKLMHVVLFPRQPFFIRRTVNPRWQFQMLMYMCFVCPLIKPAFLHDTAVQLIRQTELSNHELINARCFFPRQPFFIRRTVNPSLVIRQTELSRQKLIHICSCNSIRKILEVLFLHVLFTYLFTIYTYLYIIRKTSSLISRVCSTSAPSVEYPLFPSILPLCSTKALV